jgi:riboflavin synthase
MFTGIIKARGSVNRIETRGGDVRLTIRAPEIDWSGFETGESISINGVCLTAVDYTDDGFVTDVSTETLDVTAMSDIAEGDTVNIEPAVSLGERLGGHLVSGHVDCIGTVTARHADARSIRVQVEVPEAYSRYIAKKGSVCVDGVSLTVNEVSAGTFDVNIIPHTADVTIIGGYQPGTSVNIEVDLVARYLERLLSTNDDAGITRDFLRAHGYG